jgi:hypothetical protein
MIKMLRVLFSLIFLYLTYTVIATSIESNLFAEWSKLGAIPWMTATLKDFYANMVIVVLWMFYKERSLLLRMGWLVLFIGLGSIATSAYVLIQLFRVSATDPLEKVLLRNS